MPKRSADESFRSASESAGAAYKCLRKCWTTFLGSSMPKTSTDHYVMVREMESLKIGGGADLVLSVDPLTLSDSCPLTCCIRGCQCRLNANTFTLSQSAVDVDSGSDSESESTTESGGDDGDEPNRSTSPSPDWYIPNESDWERSPFTFDIKAPDTPEPEHEEPAIQDYDPLSVVPQTPWSLPSLDAGTERVSPWTPPFSPPASESGDHVVGTPDAPTPEGLLGDPYPVYSVNQLTGEMEVRMVLQPTNEPDDPEEQERLRRCRYNLAIYGVYSPNSPDGISPNDYD